MTSEVIDQNNQNQYLEFKGGLKNKPYTIKLNYSFENKKYL